MPRSDGYQSVILDAAVFSDGTFAGSSDVAAKIIARIEAAERANAGALAQLTRLQSVPDSELASAGLQAAAPKTAEKGAHFDYSKRGRCPASLRHRLFRNC
jgi:hypothetical protein